MVAPNPDPSRPQRPERSAVSARKRRANRRNAQNSTGPRTPGGKARAAKNSTSHGIFCRDLVLPGEDERLLRNIRESCIEHLRPQTALELMFVDRIVQAQWRLNRCQAAEKLEHARQVERCDRRAQRQIDRFHRRHGTRQELLDDPQPGDEYLLKELDILEALAEHDLGDCPGFTLGVALNSTLERALERLLGYEQKLERTMHRALLELRHLRSKDAQAWANLPRSPYAGTMVFPEPAEEADEQRTPSPRVFVRGEGGGEGQGASEDQVRSTAPGTEPDSGSPDCRGAATSSAVDRSSTPHVARPSPQPSPRSTGERESDVQNEPTAENSAASVGPAEGSDAAAMRASSPDPQEMAQLRKLTDHLSRQRPDQDDDEYDDEVT